VLTTAIGTGTIAGVFALVDGVLLSPLPYPEADRLVAVSHVAPGFELTRDGVSAGVFLHYRDRNRVFESFGAYERASFTFTDVGRPDRVQAAIVTPGLFPVLGVVPVLGRLPTSDDHTLDIDSGTGVAGALISYRLWTDRYAADPDILGNHIEIDGRPWAVVTGVAPPDFSFPDLAVRVWLTSPQERLPWSARAEVRQAMILKTVGRLRPDITIPEARADLSRLVALLPEAFGDIDASDIEAMGLRARVTPFKDVIVGEVRLTLLLVLGSAAFLLVVTWANVMNLLLARTLEAGSEISVRRALGARERDIASRLLAESFAVATAGGLLGLMFAWAAVETRLGFPTDQLPRLGQVSANSTLVLLVAVLTAASGTLMGLVCLTATRHTRTPGMSSLGSRSPTHADRHGGRRALVVAQLAFALTLSIGSGLMARTFWRLQQTDLGFEPNDRISFYLPVTHLELDAEHHEYTALHDRVMRAVRALPSVSAVEAATSSVFPLTHGEDGNDHRTTVTAPEGEAGQRSSLAEYGYATPGYFQTMGIPILAGRTFEVDDLSAGEPGVVLSASLARDLFSGAEPPVGRTVRFQDFGWPDHRVVGVVGDVPATSVRAGGSRSIYLAHVFPPGPDVSSETLHPYLPRFETYVVRTSAPHAAVVATIREAIENVDSRLPMLEAAPVEELVSDALAQERFTLRVLVASSVTSLFLGVIGVYGLIAYTVRRRAAEIGIRMALGASPRTVVGWITLRGAALSGIGVGIGMLASFWLTRFMESMLYETSANDPATFGAVSLGMFTVALAAAYVPARRASEVDPTRAMRAE
jgi:putative ABC transport system permease protein